jgi:hypothetical protein
MGRVYGGAGPCRLGERVGRTQLCRCAASNLDEAALSNGGQLNDCPTSLTTREFASCGKVWLMQLSNYDLLVLNFLESIEANSEVPEGCDLDALVLDGLATSDGSKPSLTNAGRVRLMNLKSILRGDQRLPW